MDHDSKEEKNAAVAIIAIIAALGLLGVVVVTVATVTIQLQEAEAVPGGGGCPPGPAINASKGRCIHPR